MALPFSVTALTITVGKRVLGIYSAAKGSTIMMRKRHNNNRH